MDKETKETLKKIEKHLRAIVYFQGLIIARQTAQTGLFTAVTKEDNLELRENNQEQAVAYMKGLIDKAYKWGE